MNKERSTFQAFTRRRRALDRALGGLDRRLAKHSPSADDVREVHMAVRRVEAGAKAFHAAARDVERVLRGMTGIPPWAPLVHYRTDPRANPRRGISTKK
jgi:hypothetical protein